MLKGDVKLELTGTNWGFKDLVASLLPAVFSISNQDWLLLKLHSVLKSARPMTLDGRHETSNGLYLSSHSVDKEKCDQLVMSLDCYHEEHLVR